VTSHRAIHALDHGHVWSATTDGARFATAGADQRGRLWDREGNPGVELIGHHGAVTAIRLAGGVVLTGGEDGTTRLWDATTGALRGTIDNLGTFVRNVDLDREGRLASVIGADGVVRVWDAATDRVIGAWPGHQGEAVWVGFAPDATRLVSAGLDGRVDVWDLRGDSRTPDELAAWVRCHVPLTLRDGHAMPAEPVCR
jgi:WD40 repeat protein